MFDRKSVLIGSAVTVAAAVIVVGAIKIWKWFRKDSSKVEQKAA